MVKNLLVLWNQKINFEGHTTCSQPYAEYGNESFDSVETKICYHIFKNPPLVLILIQNTVMNLLVTL